MLGHGRLRIHPVAEIRLGLGVGVDALHVSQSANAGVAFTLVEPHAITELALVMDLPASRLYASIEASLYVHATSFDRFHGVGVGARF